jgi:hypothetical protein
MLPIYLRLYFTLLYVSMYLGKELLLSQLHLTLFEF